MKTPFFLIIFTLSFCFNPFVYSQDKDATRILNDLQAKTESYKTIKAEFTYTMENKSEAVNESMDGVLYIKGNSYRLSIAGQDVICDGETVWTYIKDANEIQINYVDDDNDAITPSKLFTSYNKNYKSKFIKETKEDNRTIQIIDLTPNTGKSFTQVELKIDKEKMELVSFALYDKSGGIYTYKVTRFLFDIPLEPDKFVFNKDNYPGAEIIDMR